MEKTGWKIMAIVSMIMLILLVSLIAWALIIVEQENENNNICFYDVCSDYVQAEVREGVCFCYEEDVMGEYVLGKTEILK